jgi:uncharacterized protein (DUF433 family)
MTFERITLEAGNMGGQPCIRGLRIPVATVVAMVADGMTTDEIVIELPDLEPEDVAEALLTRLKPSGSASSSSASRREVPGRPEPLPASG